MLNWIRRIFTRSDADRRRQILELMEAMNAKTAGGEPIKINRSLGRLKLRSGTLALGDPQYLPGLEVPNIATDEVEISASIWRYPTGHEIVTELRLSFGQQSGSASRRKIGEVGIDSAKLVVADKSDFNEHWTETGNDRLGVISTARDDTVLRILTKRFKFKAVQVNPVRAEIVGPVSEQLEADIKAFLRADPTYGNFPYMYFRMQTNNSLDRVNHMNEGWQFMPVGNRPEPLMFACGTGHGDGRYDVEGQFDGEVLRALHVTFIDD
jgi:hypothetical protein